MNVPDYLLQQRSNMEVMHFHCLLKNEDMEDIVEVLDDEKVDEFMEYRICILLRWKIVALKDMDSQHLKSTTMKA